MRRLCVALWWCAVASVTLAEPAQARQSPDYTSLSDIELLIGRCKTKDSSDPPKERVRCWEALKIAAPLNPAVLDGSQAAQRALDETELRASSKAARDSLEFLLTRAQNELALGSFDSADSQTDQVLAKDPTNGRAIDLKKKISTARVWASKKRLLMAVGAVVMVVVVGLVAFAKRIQDMRKGQHAPASAAASSEIGGGRVAIRIIDGIGRGRMYTITSDMFRIGAAESARAEERNDLIISDADGLVSRFHCALLRRKKKWTIVDSSINGTWVNDQQLQRGESVSLRNGDDITVAGVSRMTFVTL